MRYVNRDCWSALIRLAHAQARAGLEPVGVSLPGSTDYAADLRKFAAQMDVPVRHWQQNTGPTYGLECVSSCYGGGVRPVLYLSGQSGHYTPSWWRQSAGLGPGALNRESFCRVCQAAEEAFRMVAEAREAVPS